EFQRIERRKGLSLRGMTNWSPNQHDDLAFPATIKLAKKDSLPATKQEFSIRERNGHSWPNEAGLDVGVGILFAVAKAHAVLRDQSAQCMKHVARHVRIGVLVHG